MSQIPNPPQGEPWQQQPAGAYPNQPPQQPSPAGPPQGDERTMMLLAHLSAPIAMLVSVGWLPFIGPLLIWLFYKDKSRAVRTASAGAFNFNLSLTIVSVLLWISVIFTLGIGFLWAIPAWIVLFVIQLFCHIKGAIRAADGGIYEYPLQIRLLT